MTVLNFSLRARIVVIAILAILNLVVWGWAISPYSNTGSTVVHASAFRE